MLILAVIVFFSRLLKVKYLNLLQFLMSLFYFKSDMNFLDTDEVDVNNSSFCIIGCRDSRIGKIFSNKLIRKRNCIIEIIV